MADSLLPQPRNPARMPEGVENFLAQATVEPLWDVAKGVGALATGQGMVPEVGAGIMGAMGIMSPGARLAKPVTQGIRAYHDSPHKFAPEPGAPLGRFKMDKIGTGEGAQAYGHGLYMAESEAVAKTYRDKLAGQNINSTARLYLQRASGDKDRALAALDADFARSSMPDKNVQDNIRRQIESGGGHMYEVNINARPEQFLDWDRPLSGQPHIADAVRRTADEIKVGWLPTFRNELQGMRKEMLTRAETGADAYSALSRGMSISEKAIDRGHTGGQARATDVLREAGIPGIKYLDQGSRTQVDDPATVLKNVERAQTQVDRARQSGDQEWLSRAQNDLMQWSKDYDLVTGKAKGTKNYVVFDDKLIDILKRYGIAGAGLSGLIAANQGDFGYQPKAPLNDTVAAAAYQ